MRERVCVQVVETHTMAGQWFRGRGREFPNIWGYQTTMRRGFNAESIDKCYILPTSSTHTHTHTHAVSLKQTCLYTQQIKASNTLKKKRKRFLPLLPIWGLPSRHMTSRQRRINVDAMSWRCIDVAYSCAREERKKVGLPVTNTFFFEYTVKFLY